MRIGDLAARTGLTTKPSASTRTVVCCPRHREPRVGTATTPTARSGPAERERDRGTLRTGRVTTMPGSIAVPRREGPPVSGGSPTGQGTPASTLRCRRSSFKWMNRLCGHWPASRDITMAPLTTRCSSDRSVGRAADGSNGLPVQTRPPVPAAPATALPPPPEADTGQGTRLCQRVNASTAWNAEEIAALRPDGRARYDPASWMPCSPRPACASRSLRTSSVDAWGTP